MRRPGRVGLWVAVVTLAWTSIARAECTPSGRRAFVAGLEALDRGDLPTAARVLYELVQSQPTCAEARNNLAVVLVEQGRLEEAEEQLRRALELQPDYRRVQINLERVHSLFESRRATPRSAESAAEQATPTPTEPVQTERIDAGGVATRTPEPTGTAVERKPAAGTNSNETSLPEVSRASATPADASLVGPPAPLSNTAVDGHGPAACVIEPGQNRLCVSQRVAGALPTEECYEITTTQVRSWPRWIVASEVSPKRIRLLDESGQTRLEIVAEDGPVSGDALRLRPQDLEALAAKIVPWRTGWLILQ